MKNKEDKKQLVIEDTNQEHSLVVKAINQFKFVQEQLKSFKALDTMLKDQFKKYDFEKVIILSETGNLTFSVTKYTQERKELDKDKLIDLLKGYIEGDLGMVDFIRDNSIPLTKDLEDILETSYVKKEVECVKYGVK